MQAPQNIPSDINQKANLLDHEADMFLATQDFQNASERRDAARIQRNKMWARFDDGLLEFSQSVLNKIQPLESKAIRLLPLEEFQIAYSIRDKARLIKASARDGRLAENLVSRRIYDLFYLADEEEKDADCLITTGHFSDSVAHFAKARDLRGEALDLLWAERPASA